MSAFKAYDIRGIVGEEISPGIQPKTGSCDRRVHKVKLHCCGEGHQNIGRVSQGGIDPGDN